MTSTTADSILQKLLIDEKNLAELQASVAEHMKEVKRALGANLVSAQEKEKRLSVIRHAVDQSRSDLEVRAEKDYMLQFLLFSLVVFLRANSSSHAILTKR